jgi:poly-gamma-glutamate capsule biosynthesis protein CapA/YwtB (metallophosphatase superfamily)
MIRIVIGGDVCPMGKVQKAFCDGNSHDIFNNLLDDIRSADLSIVNLECPLVLRETPILKAGATLSASVKCVKGFVSSGWKIINLANNHIFDHGAQGVRETIETIKKAGLSVVGAGLNNQEAMAPIVKEINGQRIVIYSMAEHEFSIADDVSPGANALDLINFVEVIHKTKQDGIFIVLIHGGKEYYGNPTPEMVRRCRFMIDIGADAVICCHTHCPLSWEIYADRPILYGLGNLIFEAFRKEPDSWHEGYLAKLIIEKNKFVFEAVPYFQSIRHIGARKMDENSQDRFFNEMEKKGDIIKNRKLLHKEWAKYCREQRIKYLSGLFGYNRAMRKMRKLLLPALHSQKNVLESLHLVQCETHREILNTIFEEMNNRR